MIDELASGGESERAERRQAIARLVAPQPLAQARPRSELPPPSFPDVEPDELESSCSLDVADGGARTLEEVAELLNLTRERVRQIETRALEKIGPRLIDHVDEEERRAPRARTQRVPIDHRTAERPARPPRPEARPCGVMLTLLAALRSGPMKRSQLAAAVDRSTNTISPTLDTMLRRGWIRRVARGMYEAVAHPGFLRENSNAENSGNWISAERGASGQKNDTGGGDR